MRVRGGDRGARPKGSAVRVPHCPSGLLFSTFPSGLPAPFSSFLLPVLFSAPLLSLISSEYLNEHPNCSRLPTLSSVSPHGSSGTPSGTPI